MIPTKRMTPARLRVLAVLLAIMMLGAGSVIAQQVRTRALFSLDESTWAYDAVTVTYRDGNTATGVAVVVGLLAALAGCAYLAARFAARRSSADPARTRRWMQVAAGVWLLSVVGAVIGWTMTTADDGIPATRVADFLRGSGDDVDAEITRGERRVPRAGGGSSLTLSAPLTVEFTLDGVWCSLTVDDPILGDGDSVTLTPFCPDAPQVVTTGG